MLGIPLAVGDYVVFHNNIYSVVGLGKAQFWSRQTFARGDIRLKLLFAGSTNRPVTKASYDCVKVDPVRVQEIIALNEINSAKYAAHLDGQVTNN